LSYAKRFSIKCKKLRVTKSGNEAETNAVKNPNNESNTTIGILENKVSDNIDPLKLQKMDRTNIFENNEFGEGISRQLLNGVNVLENKKKNILVDKAMPEWLRKKYYDLYDIKPLYVVISPFITY